MTRILVFSMLILFAAAPSARSQSFEAIPANSIVLRNEPKRPIREWRRTYQWSTVALGAAAAADIGSSFHFSSNGQREANPLLQSRNGAFGAKGAAIEAGAVGASLLLQHFLVKRHPRLRLPLAIANFGFAGFQVWNVSRNVRY